MLDDISAYKPQMALWNYILNLINQEWMFNWQLTIMMAELTLTKI